MLHWQYCVSKLILHSSDAAAAKSPQSCSILWDPIDGSPPCSALPGILQARTLEWVAISFSNAWKWKVKSEIEVAQSCPTLHNPMDRSLPGSSIHGIGCEHLSNKGFPGSSEGKSACNSGGLGSIPGLGRFSGEGNGYPLQYSFLENPMDRGGWQESMELKRVSHDWATNTYTHTHKYLFII